MLYRRPSEPRSPTAPASQARERALMPIHRKTFVQSLSSTIASNVRLYLARLVTTVNRYAPVSLECAQGGCATQRRPILSKIGVKTWSNPTMTATFDGRNSDCSCQSLSELFTALLDRDKSFKSGLIGGGVLLTIPNPSPHASLTTGPHTTGPRLHQCSAFIDRASRTGTPTRFAATTKASTIHPTSFQPSFAEFFGQNTPLLPNASTTATFKRRLKKHA